MPIIELGWENAGGASARRLELTLLIQVGILFTLIRWNEKGATETATPSITQVTSPR